MAYGTHISALGPLIPYLTAETGIIETDFSFLFSCRSFAMVAGAILTKQLQRKKMRNHLIIILGAIFMGVFSFLFAYARSPFWLGFWLFFAAAAYCLLEIVVNVCIILTTKAEDV
jgi:predicted MFS family arabinose efflux permease